MKELMRKFADEESGQGLVEYALIVVLIAVVAIAAIKLLGTKVSGIFNGINNGLEIPDGVETGAPAGGNG